MKMENKRKTKSTVCELDISVFIANASNSIMNFAMF